ncbi:MAG: carbohydrate kinase [Bacteroidetes bacterium]|nr:carbohydrate kinase [Bacteroidota bacterium]
MILSLDAGTTSMRGVLYNDRGEAEYTSRHSTSPKFFGNDIVEQDPYVWKKALIAILSDCNTCISKKQLKIEGITVTAFRSPVFPVDASGNPLLPAIMWQDKRTDALCLEMAQYNDDAYYHTGLPITSVFSAVKMLWIKNNHPQIYNKTWKMAGIYDYIMFLLTGEFITDESVASRFNLFDLIEKKWNKRLLDIFSINQDQLPEVHLPGSICGYLQNKTASLTGIQSGVPIITGGGDQQCASLGLGVTSPGKVAVNTGTGAYIIALLDSPKFDPEKKMYNNISAIPGKYILESSIPTAGTIYRWFSETFLDSSREPSTRFAQIDQEIAAAPAGSNGVLLMPYFTGEGTNGAKGAFFNLNLHTTRGDMARAILEGIAFELYKHLQKIEKLTLPIEHIYVSGGMTRFSLYNQIQADIFERPVIAYGNGEATAFGAWMNGMMGLEKSSSYEKLWNSASHRDEVIFYPQPKNFDVYRTRKAETRE